ncbi:hypothetical protein ZWY2020_012523 [Hordeum vulgare]|nr:hypothetical protein ZWY2020_012523 [Hordeum vulgare]
MTRTSPVNLASDMGPEAPKGKDTRRRIASVIVIIGCLKRATPTSSSSSNIEVIPQTAAKKPRRHMFWDDHTREQPTTPTLTTSITKGKCRTCTDRALRKRPSSAQPATKVHAATRAPLNVIIVAKQKPTSHLSKPCDEDAATHDEDATLHNSPSRGRLRDDASKEEKHARTPSSPNPKNLRFPFSAPFLLLTITHIFNTNV